MGIAGAGGNGIETDAAFGFPLEDDFFAIAALKFVNSTRVARTCGLGGNDVCIVICLIDIGIVEAPDAGFNQCGD